MTTIKGRLKPYIRILHVAKKPNTKEFKTILKITGIGVILIGTVGFIVKITGTLIK